MIAIVESLDDVLAPGAESMLRGLIKRRLLNGVSVGVVRDGTCHLRLVGKGVDRNARFELGSVTKAYTAELLAILIDRGVVRLDDPMARFVPGNRQVGPRPITLLHLAIHQSGLPRLPLGVPLLSLDPYAYYGERKLERHLAGSSLQLPKLPKFVYSNLGYSVLGYALAKAAGTTYAELLEREILRPLGMNGTALALGQPEPDCCRAIRAGRMMPRSSLATARGCPKRLAAMCRTRAPMCPS